MSGRPLTGRARVVGRGIRPLRDEDLSEVAVLRRRLFRSSEQPDVAHLAAYCERALRQGPWHDEDLTSYVYEDDSGRLAGFIGVLPKRMVFGHEIIRAVVATQMMVAPEARGLAGRELVRAVLGGPQDLTITDAANEPARRVWTSVGAREAVLPGFTWERVLSPLMHLHAACGSGSLGVRLAARAALPLLRVGDALAGRLFRGAAPSPDGLLQTLAPAVMSAESSELLSDCVLHPAYDAAPLTWLLDEARQKQSLGLLAGDMVRDANGVLAGWFMHYVTARGMSHVVQLVARRRARRMVMDHLVRDAWQHGAIAVSGRLDVTLLPLVEDPGFVVRRRAPWTLYYSTRPEISRAMETGAFFTRLDGEFCLRF